MREGINKWLGCPLPREYRQGLNTELMRTAYWPVLLVGALVILFEAALIFTMRTNWQSITDYNHSRGYFTLYIVLLVLTVLAMGACLILRGWLQKHPAAFLRLCFFYALGICLWGSYLTAYSRGPGMDTTVFIYVVMGVAAVVSLQPWQAILLFGVNQVAFALFLNLLTPGIPGAGGAVINSLIATLLGTLIASILYRSRASNYYNTVVITRQNEKIQMINAQLSALVMTDELTGAYNRRYLDEVLPDQVEEARRAGEELAVMMMDIDHFKQYNDIYGHAEGDVCLRKICEIIQKTLLGTEAVFVRYGGEEFLLFLCGPAPLRPQETAQKIRQNIARARIEHEGNKLGVVTISIGVCVSPPGDSRVFSQLVNAADAAMYKAKNEGRNRVCLWQQPGGPLVHAPL